MNLLPAFVGAPEENRVYHCDALTLLRALPAGSVDAVITDPPYYNVLDATWDRQWENRESFILWLRPFLMEFKRVLKPNGSLFLFAWPKMAAHVEVEISNHFNVLNSIVWDKSDGSTAQRADKAALCSFIPNTERIIFAEQKGSLSTIWAYIAKEMLRAGIDEKDIAKLFPSTNGSLTGCVRNWRLGYNVPTKEQYHTIRAYLNQQGSQFLKHEYEDLRRSFNMTAQDNYTDVWRFYTARDEGMVHPAQKPINLMEYMARVCTRPEGLILDPFMGSGTTLRAAKNTGRRFIGCDLDAGYVEIARERLAQPYTPDMFLQAAGE